MKNSSSYERYEATKKKKKKTKKKPSTTPSTHRISCSRWYSTESFFFFFIYFLPSSTSSSSRSLATTYRISRIANGGRASKSRRPILAVVTSDLHSKSGRHVERVSLGRVDADCTANPSGDVFGPKRKLQATGLRYFATRTACVRGGGQRKGTGAKKRIEIITPGANRNFCPDAIDAARRYPITEKNTRVSPQEGERGFSR